MKLWLFAFLIAFGLIAAVLYANTLWDLWVNGDWLQTLDTTDWNIIDYWLSGHALSLFYLQNKQLWIVILFTIPAVISAAIALLIYSAERE